MRHWLFTPILVTLSTLVCLLHTGSSISLAQNNTLKQCGETLHKTRQDLTAKKAPNQAVLVSLFDPTAQKLQQSYDNWADCVKGQKAPLLSFQTLSGESYDTTSLAGKILVVNFWFTSCAPCIAEMPAMNRLVKEYKGKNVLFLGFATDRAATLKPAFFEQHRFDFKIIAESSSLSHSFQVMGYPTTYIIDQQGIIHQAWLGFAGNGMDQLAPYRKAKESIDQLLTTASK